MRLIIADAGPLIIFAKSDKLWIVRELASEIIITGTVMMECTSDAAKPGAITIINAVKEGIIQVVVDPTIPDILAKIPIDDGEKSTIAYAMRYKNPNSVLIDEVSGRRVASKLGLNMIGSSGILLAAKKNGVIGAVEPILDEWKSLGYRLNEDLIQRVMAMAGESRTCKPK